MITVTFEVRDTNRDINESGMSPAFVKKIPPNTTNNEVKDNMNYTFTIRNPVQFDQDKVATDLSIKNPLALITRERADGSKMYSVIVDKDFMEIAKAKDIPMPVDVPSKPYNFQNWIHWAKAVKKAQFKRNCKERIDVVIPTISMED